MPLHPLEPEVEQLLVELVEAGRTVDRREREFMAIRFMGGDQLDGPNLTRQDVWDDVALLVDEGLLRAEHQQHSMTVRVSPAGLAFYEELKNRQGVVGGVEETVRSYIDDAEFASAFPTTHSYLREASEQLWVGDGERALTTIGHKLREAAIAFGSEVTAAAGIAKDELPPPERTVDRLRVVIDRKAPELGAAWTGLFKALVPYWGEVLDLLHRQEHGAAKEGRQLTWEDGRLAMFQTISVMYEIARLVRSQ